MADEEESHVEEVFRPPLTRPQQAALFLMTLGENQAAEILRHMEPKEVQTLGESMKSLNDITQEQIAEVLDSFVQNVGNQSSLSIGTEEYLKSILQKALGQEKAQSIMSRISMRTATKGLETLKWMDVRAINDLLRNEHPQIIAIILVSIDKDQASGVLALLPESVRADVVMRIARMDGINPSALIELDAIMERQFDGPLDIKVNDVGGIRAAAEILNGVTGDTGTKLLEDITEMDAETSAEIQENMFIFENLLEVDDRGFQTLLREVSSDSLVIALKGSSQEMQAKVFKNMSKRAAEMLQDDLETRGPIKLKEVEEAQKAIITVARNLAEEGKIMLGSGGEEFV